MYYRRLRRPSKPAIFAMLMVASAGLAILPRSFLSSLRNTTQLAALPQYAVTRAGRGLSQSADGLAAEPVPAVRHAEVLREKQAIENENIALQEQIRSLQTRCEQLQKIRRRPDFPENGRLIPARVVGWDAVPGRDSLVLLNRPSAKVRRGDWVASRIAIQAGSDEGIHDEFRVLAQSTLIGWIEQTAPYVSRVVLLSDRYSNRVWRVHIASVGRGDQRPRFVPRGDDYADFALEGIGEGRMRILDIDARFIEEGLIRVGDVVTTDGHDPKLPLAMVIGDIIELQQIKKQPLLYHATVAHRFDPADLSEVLVVDVSQ